MLRQSRAHAAPNGLACCVRRRSLHPPTEKIRHGRSLTGRQSGSELSDRIAPGQHLVDNFPVLTSGPTPRIDPADRTITPPQISTGPAGAKVVPMQADMSAKET